MPPTQPAVPDRDPSGFLVTAEDGTRLHFLDWGAPEPAPAEPAPGDGPAEAPGAAEGAGASEPAVLLLHGLAGTGWAWAPVARRLARSRHVVAADLRGHGLSDASPQGYRLDELAGDARLVAEAAELLDRPLVLAGHGFGAQVAATLAGQLGGACAGLVLVDGGWEDQLEATGLDAGELLRTLDEPPEVLRAMAAYLADRRGFDPATWDADQERAARAAVVELPAKRVVFVARPHVLAACVEAMYDYDPAASLKAVTAPIAALVAMDDEWGTRRTLLADVQAELARFGRPPIAVVDLPGDGHNLMRYRPDAVAAVIASVAGAGPAYHPGS